MTHDEIIEMARQAGGMFSELPLMDAWVFDDKSLEAFKKLVAAKEREACANLVENLPPVGIYRQLERATFKDAATAIRARGQQ